MKAEDFIKRLEVIIEEHGGSTEVVVYDESRRYIEPVATVMPLGGVDKIVIM
tara:strand:- start:314 stop:469 length:156 start_codon:yes stop_codon:yes gene_type:complete